MYDIRFSTNVIDLLTPGGWSRARRIDLEPPLLTAGFPVTLRVAPFPTDNAYYIALRSADDVANLSGISNIPRTLHPQTGMSWDLRSFLGADGRCPPSPVVGCNEPIGLASDYRNGVLYISNRYTILKTTRDGEVLVEWGSPCVLETGAGCVDPDGPGPLEVGDGQFNIASDVTVDKDSNVYVADRMNHRIQKFDSSGNLLAKWGSRGSSEGQFDEPIGISTIQEFYPGDMIYVADANNHRIQLFTLDGDFVDAFGSYCDLKTGEGCIDPDGAGPLELGDGQFSRPVAIEVHANRAYVVDAGNSRIQVVSVSACCGFHGKWDAFATNVTDIAVSARSYVYPFVDVDVFTIGGSRQGTLLIQRFKHDGTFVQEWETFAAFPHGLAPAADGFFVTGDSGVYVTSHNFGLASLVLHTVE